jgi:hypothetical protein
MADQGFAAGQAANAASNSASTDDTNIWAKMKPCSFEVKGHSRIVIPVWAKVEGSHGIRDVSRAVPWVDGEQLDETGLKAKEWDTEHPFVNDLCEYDPGIGKDPPLYPDRLEAFERLLEKRKTGTLHLPWRRNIRCKALTWRRSATTDMFDCETLSVHWKEDNENKLENPSTGAGVRANLTYQVEHCRFEAEREGIWDGSWEDITLFASQLEAAVAAPGQFREDIAHKANRVVRACDSMIASFSKAKSEARGGLIDPRGGLTFRGLFDLRELAANAEAEARGTATKVVTWYAPFDGSLWAIAMSPGWESQDPSQLLEINPAIPDPNWISKGTPIKVLVP